MAIVRAMPADTCQLVISPGVNLEVTLMGGQAFRWRREPDRWFSGIVRGCFIRVRETARGIEYRSDQPVIQVRPLLQDYFRLDDDIPRIHSEISNKGVKLANLVREFQGLRLLRQEPWECLVSYVCSANNNIDQIGRISERLAAAFGDTRFFEGQSRNAFPSSRQIVSAGLPALKDLKLGLKRAENVHKVAIQVEEGSLDLETLRLVSYQQARDRLLECSGIGEKIADCVLLFSLDKLEAFPIDRHIGRGLVSYFFPDLRETQLKELQRRSRASFGRHTGLIGQLLFQAIRRDSSAPSVAPPTPFFY